MGMARTKPMPPHTQLQKSSAIVMATAFNRTRRPTSCGATRLIARTWIVVSVAAINANCPSVFHLASAIRKAGSQAITAENQSSNDPGIGPHRGRGGRALPRRDLRDLPLNAPYFAFHGSGCLLQDAAVFRPVLREIRG